MFFLWAKDFHGALELGANLRIHKEQQYGVWWFNPQKRLQTLHVGLELGKRISIGETNFFLDPVLQHTHALNTFPGAAFILKLGYALPFNIALYAGVGGGVIFYNGPQATHLLANVGISWQSHSYFGIALRAYHRFLYQAWGDCHICDSFFKDAQHFTATIGLEFYSEKAH